MTLARHTLHYVDNGEGWQLELKQCLPPKKMDVRRNPIVFLPGYGMNSFIFGFHPTGASMEDFFREKGFEVWSVNLRGQGGSKRSGGSYRWSLKDLALTDLDRAIAFILKKTRSETKKVDLIGCSLGGSIAYIHAALKRNNALGNIVGMGAPLRWEKTHPLLKIAFASPKLVSKIPMFGVKHAFKVISPVLMKSRLLKLYLHKEIVDLSQRELLLQTVEDPNRYVNEEIAHWIRKQDLWIDDKNVSEEFQKSKNPLLCVIANSDGIVPPMTALSAEEMSGSNIKETLVVGTDKIRFAHADLFVSNHSHQMVFEPVANWLAKRNDRSADAS